MQRADEFRQYADEALGWARQAKTSKDRAILIEIAQTWLMAATLRERALFIEKSVVSQFECGRAK